MNNNIMAVSNSSNSLVSAVIPLKSTLGQMVEDLAYNIEWPLEESFS